MYDLAVLTRGEPAMGNQSIVATTRHCAIGVWTPLATKGDVQPPSETPAILFRSKLRGILD